MMRWKDRRIRIKRKIRMNGGRASGPFWVRSNWRPRNAGPSSAGAIARRRPSTLPACCTGTFRSALKTQEEGVEQVRREGGQVPPVLPRSGYHVVVPEAAW